MDRRSRSADADHAVEAGADGRIHADDVRAGLSLRRPGDGRAGPVRADAASALPLHGAGARQRAYEVAQVELLPQTENVFVIFKDGWHPAETPQDNAAVEWQWTKKEATSSFRNPKKDVDLLPAGRQPGQSANARRSIEVRIGDQLVGEVHR